MAATLLRRPLHSSSLVFRSIYGPVLVPQGHFACRAAASHVRASGYVAAAAAVAAAPRRQVICLAIKSTSTNAPALNTAWRQPSSVVDALSVLAEKYTSRVQKFRDYWPIISSSFPEFSALDALSLCSNRDKTTQEEFKPLLERYVRISKDFLSVIHAECMNLQTHSRSPRWLFNIPELRQAARRHGGRLSTKQVRDVLKKRGQDGQTVLERWGLTLDGMAIDHFLPKAHDGEDYLWNYILMDANDNKSFGAEFSLRKWLYVGLPLALEISSIYLCGEQPFEADESPWEDYALQPAYVMAFCTLSRS